jgi:hypothetical protein
VFIAAQLAYVKILLSGVGETPLESIYNETRAATSDVVLTLVDKFGMPAIDGVRHEFLQ